MDTANVLDKTFHPLVAQFGPDAPPDRQMLVLTDLGFHMVVETAHSMLTATCQIKKLAHRAWPYLKARLAFCLEAYNLLTQWNGLLPDENGFIPLSLAQFSL